MRHWDLSSNRKKRVTPSLAAARPDLFSAVQPFYQCPGQGFSLDARFPVGLRLQQMAGDIPPVALVSITKAVDTLPFADLTNQ